MTIFPRLKSNPILPIQSKKGYRVIIREKTEEEKQSKTEVFDMLKTNIVENGLYIRNKKGFVSIIPADEIEINELTDKGELRFTDKESGIPYHHAFGKPTRVKSGIRTTTT